MTTSALLCAAAEILVLQVFLPLFASQAMGYQNIQQTHLLLVLPFPLLLTT